MSRIVVSLLLFATSTLSKVYTLPSTPCCTLCLQLGDGETATDDLIEVLDPHHPCCLVDSAGIVYVKGLPDMKRSLQELVQMKCDTSSCSTTSTPMIHALQGGGSALRKRGGSTTMPHSDGTTQTAVVSAAVGGVAVLGAIAAYFAYPRTGVSETNDDEAASSSPDEPPPTDTQPDASPAGTLVVDSPQASEEDYSEDKRVSQVNLNMF